MSAMKCKPGLQMQARCQGTSCVDFSEFYDESADGEGRELVDLLALAVIFVGIIPDIVMAVDIDDVEIGGKGPAVVIVLPVEPDVKPVVVPVPFGVERHVLRDDPAVDIAEIDLLRVGPAPGEPPPSRQEHLVAKGQRQDPCHTLEPCLPAHVLIPVDRVHPPFFGAGQGEHVTVVEVPGTFLACPRVVEERTVI